MTDAYISIDEARDIFAAVSAVSDIGVDTLTGESRNHRVIAARRAVMWLMRKRNASTLMIGRRMQLDHTTVMHGLKKFKADPVAKDFAEKATAS